MVLSLIIGFIIGVALGSFAHISLTVFTAISLFGVIFFVYKYFVDEKNGKIVVLCSVVILGILLGFVRIEFSNLYESSHLDSYVDKKIVAEGIIVDEPDVREHNTKLTIQLSNILLDGTAVEVNEKILVTTALYPEFSYGDKVQMNVVLSEPKEIESEDGRIFDYKGYLRVRGIWYTSGFTQIKLLSSGHGNVVKSLLFKVKHAFVSSLENALPQPESSLMSGLLLGGKQSLGKELLSEFQRTGTSHVVVLSGYNIAIVAESIIATLAFLPKNISFGFGALGIVLFTVLSGGGASAWRAAIMVLVALFAKRSNRDYKVSRALGFAIVLMLAENPALLVFDPSFQLSILATIGLIFVSPFVSPYLTKITERFGLREIVSATVATQIVVLPYLIYNTGILSTISLPVNILILGTVPITMFFGFITGIVGLFSLWLSFVPALFAYVLLRYQLTVVHIGSSIPFGAISLPPFSPFVLFLVYALIFAVFYYIKKKI